VDGQESSFTWFLDGNEKSFEPYGGFGSFSSSYYDNGALDQMIFPNSAQLTQRYNPADLATSRVFTNSSGTKLSAWESILYDENNNRTTETVTQAQPAGASPAVQTGAGSFGYDPLDRLDSFKHPFETATASYGLDDAGNLTSEPGPASPSPTTGSPGAPGAFWAWTASAMSAITSATRAPRTSCSPTRPRPATTPPRRPNG
jgi:hypothetical protein